jgi:hypothetical protein
VVAEAFDAIDDTSADRTVPAPDAGPQAGPRPSLDAGPVSILLTGRFAPHERAEAEHIHDGQEVAESREPNEAFGPLVTVGHGTMAARPFASLLADAGIASLVDVRTAPGSRRAPEFSRVALERWLPESGIAYRWEPRLGGFRKPRADSVNTVLHHAGFRGYADHMATPEFQEAMGELCEEARGCGGDRPGAPVGLVCIMCAESVWWRCHRRLIADAAVLRCALDVRHLMHDGSLRPHHLTEGVRLADDDVLVYDAGQKALPGT